MVTRIRTQFVCSECGGTAPKWQGQCPHCQAWNTLAEAREAARATPAAAPGATLEDRVKAALRAISGGLP